MNINKNDVSGTEIFAYLAIIVTFCISLTFPLIFKYVDSFAAPTAVYANQVLRYNESTSNKIVLNPPHDYWKSAIEDESNYPAPYLLISIFMLISGIPNDYTMFIPLNGIASIIFFVLARHLLRSYTNIKSYTILFAALYYAFETFTQIAFTYVGRAVLGVMLFAYFLFCYVRFLQGWVSNQPERSWAILLLLLALIMGYTYYTATFIVIVIATLLMITVMISSKPRISICHGFSILILAVFLFINNPSIVELVSSISLTSYIENFQEYTGYMLGKFGIHLWSSTRAMMLNEEFVDVDLISVVGRRIAFAIQYSSIIAIIALLTYKLRNKHIPHTVWLFSLIVLFSGLGEFFGYLVHRPNTTFRLITMFGLIATFFIVGRFVSKYSSSGHKKMKIIVLLTILFISLGCWGTLRWAWRYGMLSGKPFVYQEVKPLSEFLCKHSSNEKTVTLTGDIYYMANIFFITSIHNKTDNVIPEPLLIDAITLHKCWDSGRIQDFFTRINERGIKYLLLVENTRPIWGDVWGWSVEPPDTDKLRTIPVNLVYSDGYSLLYCLPKTAF